MRTASTLLVAVSLAMIAPPADAKPKKKREHPPAGAAKTADAAPAQDASREALDQAITLIKKEQYAEAAVALERYLSSSKTNVDEAQYHLGKTLYRMGLYHSALSYFDKLLKEGPKSKYYKSALEWCLFISRKTKDQDSGQRDHRPQRGHRLPGRLQGRVLLPAGAVPLPARPRHRDGRDLGKAGRDARRGVGHRRQVDPRRHLLRRGRRRCGDASGGRGRRGRGQEEGGRRLLHRRGSLQ